MTIVNGVSRPTYTWGPHIVAVALQALGQTTSGWFNETCLILFVIGIKVSP